MIILDCMEQGSDDWLKARSARITASRAAEFSAKASLAPMPEVEIIKLGKVNRCEFNGLIYENSIKSEVIRAVRESLPRVYSDMRNGYMSELIGQICTGEIKEQIPFKQAEWGHKNEPIARSLLEFETGEKINQVGFIYRDENQRAGISPDGIIDGKDIGVEIKCPWDTKWHIDFILSKKIKPEYVEQCQFSMWVTGYSKWYFASYDPRMNKRRLHYVVIDRDKDFMKKYDESYDLFIEEMDIKLNQIGFSFKEYIGDKNL
mgnify:CR=1 FL=1